MGVMDIDTSKKYAFFTIDLVVIVDVLTGRCPIGSHVVRLSILSDAFC